MLKSAPTFSEVWPIGCVQSTDSWLAMMAGWNADGVEPPSDMDSAPMAIPTSMLPVATWAAMS